jgi:hypothetical protein
MAILRSPRARKGREEAMCPRFRELAGTMAEEIEPGEDDQHGEAEETGGNCIEHDSGFTAVRIGCVGRHCARQCGLPPRNRFYTAMSNTKKNRNTLLN